MANEFVARKGLIVSGSTTMSGSLEVDGYVSASEVSGSFFGDGSGLTNVVAEITGTTTFSEQFVSQSSVLITHNLSTTSPIVQVYDENDEQIIPTKIKIQNDQQVLIEFPSEVSGKVVVAKGGHLFLENPAAQYSQEFVNQTSITVVHLLDTISPFVQIYDEENEQVIPQRIKAIDTSTVLVEFPTSTSGTIVVAKGGHIIDAANLSYVAQSFTNTSLVSVVHNFGTDAPIVQVYDDNGLQVIPQEIRIIDGNSLEVEFPTNISGKVAVSRGGHIIQADNISIQPTTSGSFTGSFTATQAILPNVTDQIDIGSPTNRFKDIYLSGSTIYLGNVTLSESEEGTLEITTANQVTVDIADIDLSPVNNKISNLEVESGSIRTTLNNYTSSANLRLNSLETESGSIRTDFINFSSSIVQTIDELEVGGGSTDITDLNNFTSSADLRLESLETESGSIRTALNNYTSSTDSRISSIEVESGSIRSDFNSYTSSTDIRITELENFSSSLDDTFVTDAELASTTGSIINTFNSYTSSTDLRLDSIETESGSIRTTLNNYTSSADSRLGSLEAESGSIRTEFNNYTSSIATAISVDETNVITNGNLTVAGDLLVQGTQSIFNTETFVVEDNIIELNTAGAIKGGILVGDVTAPSELSGSLLWDGANDYWVAGISGSEERIILESEFTSYTSSTDLRVGALETESGSIRTTLNNYTSSADLRLDSLETESGSVRTTLNNYTSSTDLRLDSIETESGSIRTTLNNYTSSADLRLGTLETESGSIRTDFSNYTSSADLRLGTLETESGSIRTDFSNYTSSTDNRIDELENFSSSLDATFATDAELEAATSSIISAFNDYTSSTDLRVDTLETESGSIRADFSNYTSSADLRLGSLETESGSIRTTLNNYTSSADLRLDSLETESGSIRITLNNYTSSTDLRVDALETESGSIRTDFSNYTSSTDLRLGSLETESGSIRTDFSNYTSSTDSRIDELENFSSSLDDTFATDAELGTATSSIITTLNNYTSSTDLRIDALEVESGSIRTTLNNYTSSADLRLDSLEIESGSIRGTFNNFTSSVDAALTFNNEDIVANGNITVTGDLLVQGTQSIFNTEQFSVENNVIELNTAGAIKGGILVGDITAPSELSGSLLWDGVNDHWIAGISGSEQRIILENTFNNYTSSIDTKILSLETESGSIRNVFNSYTSSADLRLDSLETESGSIRTTFNNFTSSADLRLSSLEVESGSIRTTFNNYTGSANLRLDSLEIESGSIRTTLNNFTGSLGNISTQSSGSVSITGGSINGTSIGATSTSTGAFTNLSYTGTLTGGTGVVNLGSGQLVKDASGNVGIGTASPSAALDVQGGNVTVGSTTTGRNLSIFSSSAGNNGLLRIFDTGNTERLQIGASTDTAFYFAPTGTNHAWFVGTERMRIDSAGNVGIGSTNPGARLAIRGIGTTSATFALDVANVNGNTHMAVRDDGEVIFFGSSLSETLRLTAAGNLLPGSNNAYDLGATGSRFRDGWFARDVSAGGTLRQSGAIGSGTANTTVIANSSGQAQIWALGPDTSTRGSILFVVARSDLTSSIESLRIDSAGNVGIGVTPSAWTSTWRVLQLGGGSGNAGSVYVNAGGTTGQIGIAQNWFFDGSANKYITTAAASDYFQFGGTHVWRTAPSGTAGNTITFEERMRIDSAGRLLLNQTSTFATFGARAILATEEDTTNDSIALTIQNKANVNTFITVGLQFSLAPSNLTQPRIIAKKEDFYGNASQATASLQLKTAFQDSLITALDLRPNGTVQLPSGSPGIKFGTRNANLADYEEGTWTPVCNPW
jgi:lipopolysaccharide export system protein LptC